MESVLPLVRDGAIPLVRMIVRDAPRQEVDPNEPKVIVDPSIYREAEEQSGRRPRSDVERVARRLRSLVDPPRTR